MNSPPIVTTSDKVILLGNEWLPDEFFSATDPDGDPIMSYRFLDGNSNSDSGYFTVGGIRRAANVWFEVTAAELSTLAYHAGTSIQRDFLSARAYDGMDWGPISSFFAYTARANTTRPIGLLQNFTVVSEEFVFIQDFISVSDPDGWPITKIRIRDRDATRWGGFFIFDGSAKRQGEYFEVDMKEVSKLRFRSGAFGQSELIDFMVFDGVDWSFRVEAIATTKQNAHRPEVFYNYHLIKQESTIDANLLFDWFDLDGNTAKRYRFYDTAKQAFSGYFTVDGVRQNAKEWIEITAAQLGKTQFFTASTNFLENLRVRVFDGRYWSAVQTVQIQTITKPTLISQKYVVLPQLQNVFLSDLFSKSDNGPAYLKYELFDANSNPLTGNVIIGGTPQEGGKVVELSAAEFATGMFRSGTYFEGSFLDDLYARAFNGTFWSDWTRVNVRTEAEYFESMAIRIPGGFLNWNLFLPPELMETFTYSFQQSGDNQISNTQRAEFRKGFDYLESILDIKFVEVRHLDPTATGTGGFIRISTYDGAGLPLHQTFGPRVHLPFQIGYDPLGADMQINEHMDPDGDPDLEFYGPNRTWDKDGFLWHDFLKMSLEMMGLRSPSGGLPTLPDSTDNQNYSLLSTNDRGDGRLSRSVSLYDLNALHTFYEPSKKSAGDNVYDIANYWKGDTDFVDLIYDYGGIDTLDFSDLATNNEIKIRPGDFSSVGGIRDNLSIAYNTIIENVIGGSGNDQIIGNEEDNILKGGDGDDLIDGQGGNDMATGGRGNDTYIYRSGDDQLTINEEMGTGKDKIQFRQVFSLDSFSEDLSFRKLGRDLYIDLTFDGGDSGGQIVVKDQEFGTYRVETLEVLGVKVDLDNIFAQATNEFQRFKLLTTESAFGFLSTPV